MINPIYIKIPKANEICGPFGVKKTHLNFISFPYKFLLQWSSRPNYGNVHWKWKNVIIRFGFTERARHLFLMI